MNDPVRCSLQILQCEEQRIAQGEIKKDANPGKVAKAVFSMIEGGFLISKLLNDRQYYDSSLEQALEIINGLSAMPDTVAQDSLRTNTKQENEKARK
ncbi:MAG: hypothetical protein LBR52_03205 [Prevotellaceae bacterium]|jgi:hypothetical protein|nr:hypothetical protein [Prevotellaceae bacterium]